MPDDMGLVERIREAARDIRNDGTPSQVGLTDEECETIAAAIERLEHECQTSMATIASERARAEAAEATIERLLAERDEARRANERDRTIIIDARNAIHDAIVRRSWLLEGRGSYEWDDERYRQEFSAAIDEIGKPLETLERLGIDWTNCPTDQAEIARARQALQDKP